VTGGRSFVRAPTVSLKLKVFPGIRTVPLIALAANLILLILFGTDVEKFVPKDEIRVSITDSFSEVISGLKVTKAAEIIGRRPY
jgi:hypothetical protein